jgi:hypothetical protein
MKVDEVSPPGARRTVETLLLSELRPILEDMSPVHVPEGRL